MIPLFLARSRRGGATGSRSRDGAGRRDLTLRTGRPPMVDPGSWRAPPSGGSTPRSGQGVPRGARYRGPRRRLQEGPADECIVGMDLVLKQLGGKRWTGSSTIWNPGARTRPTTACSSRWCSRAVVHPGRHGRVAGRGPAPQRRRGSGHDADRRGQARANRRRARKRSPPAKPGASPHRRTARRGAGHRLRGRERQSSTPTTSPPPRPRPRAPPQWPERLRYAITFENLERPRRPPSRS